jgi:hypothetical protein
MNINNRAIALLISFFLFAVALIPVTTFAKADITPSAKQQRVYLLLGQSNMSGQGKVAELAANHKTLPKNVEIYLHGKPVKIANLSKFGPEVAFAHSVAKKYPTASIRLVKFAPGGSLMKDWTLKARGKHYDTLIKQVKKSNQGKMPQINGVLWMHGERDSKSVKLANHYAKYMQTFIKMLQSDFHNPKIPFVIARISVPEAFRPAIPNIRAVQEQIAKSSPYIKMISTDDLTKTNDQVHFDTKGQLALGKRFAQVM